jgi:hypothetical protein
MYNSAMNVEFMRGESTCPGHEEGAEFVARGNDSRVLRVEGKIHKIYDQDLLHFRTTKQAAAAQVALYLGIHNGASILSELEDWEISLPHLYKHYPLRVVRFLDGKVCVDCGILTATQEEIKGPNLEDDERFPDREAMQKVLEVTGEWIETRLNVTGIYLSLNNLKFVDNMFMVTDTASVISGIKPYQ